MSPLLIPSLPFPIRRPAALFVTCVLGVALGLLRAGPAEAACNAQGVGALPATVKDIEVHPWSTENFSVPVSQKECLFLENVGGAVFLGGITHRLEEPGTGVAGPWPVIGSSMINISGGVSVTCNVTGSDMTTTPVGGSLAPGAVTDICCYTFGPKPPGTCNDLPAPGDIARHTTPDGTTVEMPLLGYLANTTTCGLVGLELLVLVPIVRAFAARRRRRRQHLHVLSLLPAAFLLSPASPARAGVPVELSPAASASLPTRLLSMGEDAAGASVEGSLTVELSLVDDPGSGLVAYAVEFRPGSLAIADLQWALSGPYEDFSTSLQSGQATFSSGPLAATAVSYSVSRFDASGITLMLAGGELQAQGIVLDHRLDVLRDLQAEPRQVLLSGAGTVETSLLPSGLIDVTLTLPVKMQVPIDPPFLVSWLEVDGSLVLSGTAVSPATLPATRHPAWVALALLGAWLAVHAGTARRARGRAG